MSPLPAPRLVEAGPINAGLPCLEAEDDAGLLARLLGRTAGTRDTGSAVRQLMARYGRLGAVLAADAAELARIGDLTRAALEDLKLVRLLCERAARSEASAQPVISSWSSLQTYVRVALSDLPREQFRVLFLDKRNRLLSDEFVAEGTVDHAPVYPREVLRRALEVSASALILVHNHPSGDPEPSQADIAMTRQVVEAAAVFQIQVHDHLIVARHGTASFRSLGLFP